MSIDLVMRFDFCDLLLHPYACCSNRQIDKKQQGRLWMYRSWKRQAGYNCRTYLHDQISSMCLMHIIKL